MQNRLLILLAFPILLAIPRPGCADMIFVSNHGGDTGNPNTIEQFTSGGVGSVFANTGSSNYSDRPGLRRCRLFICVDGYSPAYRRGRL